MIEAHTIDAWTRPADRRTAIFGSLGLLGGFAAPLFLWLAGVGVALSATRTETRTGSRTAAVEAIFRRGLEIFILAFAFRLQAFVLSPGSHPITLFRVDILNIMGPSIAAAALVWAVSTRTTGLVAAYAVIAASVALVTPVIRIAPFVNALPLWFQWYVRPAGEYTTFTAFPWAGFVFAGVACGVLLAAAQREGDERRLHVVLAGIGAALVAIGWYTSLRPTIYHQSSFWTSSPTWFAIRVGVMMIALAALYALGRFAERHHLACRPLERLGRASLFIYWVHIELVYGYASWLWRRRLPLGTALLAFAAFSALMYGLVIIRDRVVQRWSARVRKDAQPQAAAI
jgi:uncharacterized membrane protein